MTSIDSANYGGIHTLFLVKFDHRKGYILEWYKQIDDSIPLENIEFKSLPSGIHSVSSDVVYFTQPYLNWTEGTNNSPPLFDGMSVFMQNKSSPPVDDGNNEANERDVMNIYSLGIMLNHLDVPTCLDVEPDYSPNNDISINTLPVITRTTEYGYANEESVNLLPARAWDRPDNAKNKRPRQLMSKSWTYVDKLRSLLRKFMQMDPNARNERFELLHAFYTDEISKNKGADMDSAMEITTKHSQANHPALSSKSLLNNLGASILPLVRQCISRKRILIVASTSLWSGFLSTASCLNDIPWLSAMNEYIAFTTDEILAQYNALYDCVVYLKDNNTDVCVTSAPLSHQKKHPLSLSLRDSRRYVALMQSLKLRIPYRSIISSPSSLVEAAGGGLIWWATAGESLNIEAEWDAEGLIQNDRDLDQSISIITATAISRTPSLRVKPSIYSLRKTNSVPSSATTPILSKATSYKTDSSKIPISPLLDLQAAKVAISLVGYFQYVSARLVEGLVSNIENQAMLDSSPHDSIIIKLSDMFQMGLDPFNKSDRILVADLVRNWWGREVRLVWLDCWCCY
ncbi:hypothetical protein NADFUDRAFT_80012 [Nadsonia fulvescens var. elongata DSM 6958]|uniref:DUF4484 domain-containing protein n=1 Tax=Nadsonia fulvescens var. elongata DSM 6958 TaxID=857566 RepID=A0A1E3PG45_9ASCO|nr:hypothetical protein NADFUDRAFT_80012 [Nadsonia fulvescens var. elongata DSM 6958]